MQRFFDSALLRKATPDFVNRMTNYLFMSPRAERSVIEGSRRSLSIRGVSKVRDSSTPRCSAQNDRLVVKPTLYQVVLSSSGSALSSR